MSRLPKSDKNIIEARESVQFGNKSFAQFFVSTSVRETDDNLFAFFLLTRPPLNLGLDPELQEHQFSFEATGVGSGQRKDGRCASPRVHLKREPSEKCERRISAFSGIRWIKCDLNRISEPAANI